MTQHDKLFALYAANIAAGRGECFSIRNAQRQLTTFNSTTQPEDDELIKSYEAMFAPTPPAQEETGLEERISKLEGEIRLLQERIFPLEQSDYFNHKPIR